MTSKITKLIVLSICSCLVLLFLSFNTKDKTPLPNDIKHGDIILTSSTSWRAFVMVLMGNVFYTHAAIAVKNGGNLQILQAAPKDKYSNGLVSNISINNFFEDVTNYTILRETSFSEKFDSSKYINKAFDYDFNREDTSKIYCTELINNLLIDSGFEQFDKNKEYIWPKELEKHLQNLSFTNVIQSVK